MSEEQGSVNVQIFRVATPRSAIFRVKRWFYANFYTPNKKAGREDVAEENKKVWEELARTLIERIGDLGVDAIRITLEYSSKVLSYEVGKGQEPIPIVRFKPIKAKIEMFRKIGEEEIPFETNEE